MEISSVDDFEIIKKSHLMGFGILNFYGGIKGKTKLYEADNMYMARNEKDDEENGEKKTAQVLLMHNPNIGGYLTIIAKTSNTGDSAILEVGVFNDDKQGVRKTTVGRNGMIIHTFLKEDGSSGISFDKIDPYKAGSAIDAYIASHSWRFNHEESLL